jgi:hypothetical protein
LNPDLIIVVLGLFGSAALALMAFAFGFNKNAILGEDAEIAELVRAFAPDVTIEAIVVASTRRSALVKGIDGQLYLVTLLGNKPVVRQLSPAQFKPIGGGHIRIDPQDFGYPALDFHAPQSTLIAILNKTEGDVPR